MHARAQTCIGVNLIIRMHSYICVHAYVICGVRSAIPNQDTYSNVEMLKCKIISLYETLEYDSKIDTPLHS